jgi:hypothetical protein
MTVLDVLPLARIVMPDVKQYGYRACPLPDHLADKVVATFQRYGPQQLPSMRCTRTWSIWSASSQERASRPKQRCERLPPRQSVAAVGSLAATVDAGMTWLQTPRTPSGSRPRWRGTAAAPRSPRGLAGESVVNDPAAHER